MAEATSPDKPLVPTAVEAAEAKKPKSTDVPAPAEKMDDIAFQKGMTEIRDGLAAARKKIDEFKAKDSLSDEEEKAFLDMPSELNYWITKANTLVMPPLKATESQQAEINAIKTDILSSVDLVDKGLDDLEKKDHDEEEKKAKDKLDGSEKPDAPRSADDFKGRIEDAAQAISFATTYLTQLNTQDGIQEDEGNVLTYLNLNLPALKAEIQNLESAVSDPAQKGAVEKMKAVLETTEKKVNEMLKSPEQEKPKSRTEQVMDGLSKLTGDMVDGLAKIGKAISDALARMGPGMRKALMKLKGIPVLGLLAEWVRPAAEVDDIHEKIEQKLGKGSVLKTDSDEADAGSLAHLYEGVLKGTGKTSDKYTFDQFIQNRAAALAAEGRAQISIADLVGKAAPEEEDGSKPAEDKKDEAAKGEKLEKQLSALKDAKATDEGSDTWRVDTDVGEGLAAVRFKKTAAGTWEWANGRAPYGRFDDKKAGLTPAQIENRKNMNALADALDVSKVAPAPAAPETVETPDQRKDRYMTGLIEAFNDKAGSVVVTVNAVDKGNWKVKASDFIGALQRDEYQDGLSLELGADDLESTDTSGSGLGVDDMDILDGWAKQLQEDPERAVKSFMQLDPSKLGLDSGSAKGIRDVQTKLRELKLA